MMFRIIACVLTLGLNAVYADTVHIAVAANFTQPIKTLKTRFEDTTRHQLIISLGSTGQLYAQIKNGAPYEVFLAADTKRPQLLVEEGEAVAESLVTYAIGQLILWSPKPDFVNDTVLKTGDFQHLAIANPKTAPYGAAAVQVLEKLGLWASLQPKIVQGENITQTYQFVVTQNAELGFVALSQYQGGKQVGGSHWLIPQAYYDPIEQGAVLLTQGTNNPAAQAFMTFLTRDEARDIIQSFGYTVVKH